MKDYITDSYSMFLGAEDAAQYIYRKVITKNGDVWLYPINSQEAGANIYHHDPKDTKSQGFGGSTLSFELEDGTKYKAKGPWHSNSDSLFKRTNVDLRNQHLTLVVLGTGIDYENERTKITGVVYCEHKPKLGNFNRYKEIIQQYPQATHYYTQSNGGSSCGQISKEDRK